MNNAIDVPTERKPVGLSGLSTRARNVLVCARLNNVDEVRAEWRRREPNGFLQAPNCGKVANAEIRAWAGIDTAVFPSRNVVLAIDLLTENGYTVLPPATNKFILTVTEHEDSFDIIIEHQEGFKQKRCIESHKKGTGEWAHTAGFIAGVIGIYEDINGEHLSTQAKELLGQ